MEFSPEFFFDEVRDGFLVPTMIKKAWAVGMKDYMILDEQCQKLGLSCTAMFGTMLGAIRYGGYIPWDDDMDVELLRHDYNKLFEYAKKKGLPDEFVLRDYRSIGNDNLVRKWMDASESVRDPEKWEESFGFPFMNNVDIFLTDYIPDGADEEQYYKDVVDVISQIKLVTDDIKEHQRRGIPLENTADGLDAVDKEEYAYNLDLIQRVLKKQFDLSEKTPLVHQLWEALEEFCERYKKDSCHRIISLPYFMKDERKVFPRELYEVTVEVPFETGTARVPIGYDRILRLYYGNYCYPVVAETTHGYPYYRMLEKDLLNLYGGELLRYRMDRDEVLNVLEKSKENRIVSANTFSEKDENVVFLVDRAVNWKALHTLWEEEKNKENTQVYVIAVPYFLCEYNGQFDTEHMIIETEGYPGGVKLTPFDAYDFDEKRSARMYYLNPYDEYSYAMSVHPFFYAKNIVLYTDELIFVTPFMLREISPGDARSRFTLGMFLKNPGLVYADRILAQSEGMRNVYIELLKQMDTDGVINWEKKVESTALPIQKWKEKKRILIRREGSQGLYLRDTSVESVAPEVYDDIVSVPEEWFDKIYDKTGKKRAVILVYFSASVVFEYGDRIIEKAHRIARVIEANDKDTVILWEEDPNMQAALQEHKPTVWSAYQDFINEIKAKGSGIWDDSGDENRAAVISDAFYGDGSTLMTKCRVAKKPVIWETPGVTPVVKTDDAETRNWDSNMVIIREGESTLQELMRIIN